MKENSNVTRHLFGSDFIHNINILARNFSLIKEIKDILETNQKLEESNLGIDKLNPLLEDLSKGMHEDGGRKLDISFENIMLSKPTEYELLDYKGVLVKKLEVKSTTIVTFAKELQEELDKNFPEELIVELYDSEYGSKNIRVFDRKNSKLSSLQEINFIQENYKYFFNWLMSTSSIGYIVYRLPEVIEVMSGVKEFESQIDEIKEFLKEVENSVDGKILTTENTYQDSRGTVSLSKPTHPLVYKDSLDAAIKLNNNENIVLKSEVNDTNINLIDIDDNEKVSKVTRVRDLLLVKKDTEDVRLSAENTLKEVSEIIAEKQNSLSTYRSLEEAINASEDFPRNFKVLEGDKIVEYYAESADVYHIVAYHPTYESIQNVLDSSPMIVTEDPYDIAEYPKSHSSLNSAYSIVDTYGNVAFAVDSEGKVFIDTIKLPRGESLKLGKAIEIINERNNNGSFLTIKDAYENDVLDLKDNGDISTTLWDILANYNAEFSIEDSTGRSPLYIDQYGNVHIQSLKVKKLNAQEDVIEEETKKIPVMSNVKTDIMHVFSYGQSLSRGATANPPVSTKQPYSNITFGSGVLSRYDSPNLDLESFIPLVEKKFHSGSEAETPISGTLNNLTKYQVSKGDSANKWVFLGSSPGRGGAVINSLNKGTINWNGMIEQVKKGKETANRQGKSYSVWAMTWTQGENDYTSKIGREAYKKALIDMVEDFSQEVNKITNQGFKPPVFTYQVAAHIRYGVDNTDIALAQWDVAREDPSVVMTCAMYQLDYNTDNLHLTADSSYQLGKYYSKAMIHTVLEKKGKFLPMYPTNVINQGTILDVYFHVPKGKIVLDTNQVTETYNYGFDIWNKKTNDVEDIIKSVQILDKDRIRITLTKPINESTHILTYARGRKGDPKIAGNKKGARGNFRDEEGLVDNYKDSKGVTRYMHNWCIIFEYNFEKGTF